MRAAAERMPAKPKAVCVDLGRRLEAIALGEEWHDLLQTLAGLIEHQEATTARIKRVQKELAEKHSRDCLLGKEPEDKN